jgi:hypothetical protein
MSKASHLTKEIHTEVNRILIEHPEWRRFPSRVHSEFHAKNPGLHVKYGEDSDWPGEDAIGKYMRKLPHKLEELLDTGDKPWSLISAEDYPIPPEALPVVLRVWAHSLRKKRPLTERQAIWVSRLCCVFDGKSMSSLWEAAVAVAYHEKVFKVDDHPATEEGMAWYWATDANLYGQLPNESAADIEDLVQGWLEKSFGVAKPRRRGAE